MILDYLIEYPDRNDFKLTVVLETLMHQRTDILEQDDSHLQWRWLEDIRLRS